jgi:hypothetical protein
VPEPIRTFEIADIEPSRPETDADNSAYRALAQLVLHRAVKDLKAGDEDAIAFFDPKSASLQLWCGIAGVDPEKVLSRLHQYLVPIGEKMMRARIAECDRCERPIRVFAAPAPRGRPRKKPRVCHHCLALAFKARR